jgi:hypothetical protein
MATEQTLYVRRIRAGTIYKLLFVGLVTSFIPLGIACGVAAYFGFDTVTFNHQHLHGWTALLASPFIAGLGACIFALFIGTFASLGLWFVSFVRLVSIRVVFDV